MKNTIVAQSYAGSVMDEHVHCNNTEIWHTSRSKSFLHKLVNIRMPADPNKSNTGMRGRQMGCGTWKGEQASKEVSIDGAISHCTKAPSWT